MIRLSSAPPFATWQSYQEFSDQVWKRLNDASDRRSSLVSRYYRKLNFAHRDGDGTRAGIAVNLLIAEVTR